MDKTDRLRNYGLAFLLYKQGLGVCGYELIRELFIFIKLILNSYLYENDQKKRLSADNLFLLKFGVYEWWHYATFGALVSMSSIFVTAKTVL